MALASRALILTLFFCAGFIFPRFLAYEGNGDCYTECGSKVVLDEDDFDVTCNDTCKIQKCHDGCDSWMDGIATSCQDACEEEKVILSKTWNLYCAMGCNIAISIYITKLKDDLGTPSPPYLVADTCTHDSVTIQWAPAPFQNISYLVQWRYEALHQSLDWEYYESMNMLKSNQLTLVGLQPYTNYKFRVAWILLRNITPLFSEESVVISTLPHGTPSTSPKITCLTAVGPTRVSINWEPPVRPNGPVLSYVLYVKEHPSGSISIKDVSDVSGGFHYMFNNLNPSTTYIISVSTRNKVGEGPVDTRNITTPTRDPFSNSHHPVPYLIFSAKEKVLKQGLRILDEPSILYQNSNDSVLITGIALHVKKEMFFASDSEGLIHHVHLKGDRRYTTIGLGNVNSPLRVLSIDWLNEKLYVAETNEISRCNFKGEHCEVVLIGLMCQPSDVHVDPFNGYLFWATKNPTIGGVYRMDLAELDSGPRTLEDAQLIVKDAEIMAFSVDYKNFRLLIPVPSKNTIISTALDGSDGIDIRTNSQTAQFKVVRSIATHKNLFYWTNGHEVFGEEYHREEDTYYHNPYLLSDEPFSSINIHHPHCQPDPVPLNGAEAVQAIFADDVAKIKWLKPRPLGGLGKGAWQKWIYEVHLINHTTGMSLFEKNITKTKHTIYNLTPNSTYSIKIRAYSSGGKGPWSSEFVGRTLKTSSSQKPSIIWSAREGLLKSDVIGNNVLHLIPKIYLNNAHVIGICWFDGQIFLNTNSSWVYVYNMNGNHTLTRLMNVTNAASIAIDWLAPKIYWSSPVQQMISRANLDGSQSEPLPIFTMAKQLAIDSGRARIYWATSHSVECSRLNGEEHITYMKNELFSGKHIGFGNYLYIAMGGFTILPPLPIRPPSPIISGRNIRIATLNIRRNRLSTSSIFITALMGLTLDFDKNQIYWVVRSHEGSLMYKASLTVETIDPESEIEYEFMGSLPEDNVRGPLWYFSDRLFWLHDHKGALVSDVNGHNVASLQASELIGIKAMTIIDPSLHPNPSDFAGNSIRVVPNSVADSSIRVEGTWNSFNITWEPVLSINYGFLFYEMKVDDGEEIFTLITDEPMFSYPKMRLLKPYTPLSIAVKAYTYWASARQTIVLINSPMSTPSKPLHPRVFITYKDSLFNEKRNIQALFRWSRPASPNGVISGYEVTYWTKENGAAGQYTFKKINSPNLQFYLNNLKPDTVYFFQVRAFTEVGFGPHSEIVHSKTSEEHPVPQLLLAKTDSVKITDIDTHEQKILSSKISRPAAVAYLAHEGRIFWIEEDGSLMSSLLDGTNITLLRHLTSKVSSLTVDWIGRQLYWVEIDHVRSYSSIWSLDLNFNTFPNLILNHSGIITALEAEPLTSSLLWIVKKTTHCELMISNNKGMEIKSFFWQSATTEKNSEIHDPLTCNCWPNTSRAITIDSSDYSHPKLLLADGKGHIWSSDMDGCICQLLVNASEVRYSGLPPTSLTVDQSRIYWSNETLGKLFSIARETLHSKNLLSYKIDKSPKSASYKSHEIASEEIRGIRVIRAIGNYLQPFPDPSCLYPSPYNKTAKLISRSSTSLTLYFPPADYLSYCGQISTALTGYTVHYGLVFGNVDTDCVTNPEKSNFCMIKKTYNGTMTIDALQPFSNYSIRVSVSNYYSKGLPHLGPAVVFQTEEGAPSPPTNVSIQVVTPFRIDVYWQPPLFPNSYPIQYEVRWRTDNMQKSVLYGQQLDKSEERFVMSINTNEPGTEHFIAVRAYSCRGKLHNDSEEISVISYSLPNNITLSNTSSHSLEVQWLSPNESSVIHHVLEYSKIDSFEWHAVSKSLTESATSYEFTISNLSSKTKYNFRLLLTYSAKKVIMEWPQWLHDPYFVFETHGDSPGPPGPPEVYHVSRDVYQVVWTEAVGNDGDDLVYELQMRSKDEFDDWITVYNSSNTQWIIKSISENGNYVFRVRAVNEYGGSNFSFSQEPFFLPQPGAFVDSDEDQVTIILASGVGSLILIVTVFAIMYMVHRRREKEKKVLHDSVTQNQLAPELELATLQELPHHGNFIHQTNALYNLGELPTDEELLALPRVQRGQIILKKFLGRGQFGEVFEGLVYDLHEGSSPMKIAIKTLRKGATDYEKEEFLKEAKLMSNFKHDHVLQLLGVCFDNNPNFLILELMEGGDLLSFLRCNRPSLFQQSILTLDDLFAICVDVAEGCKYLEDMHFVHRDLAARNCLVSSFDRQHRIVKIGDFGLARDIYKSDYYRKEGEGILPVRWMAPESLVYGIFTSQSDVWAFGILLWEVMTLGQQPYPARTNIEVLNFVKAGGRLDKPENCPDDLHEVMISCWCYDPEGRPSFSYCLNVLQELRQKALSSPTIFSAVQNENYLSPSINGFENFGYSGDELIILSETVSIEDEEVKPPDGYIVANNANDDSVKNESEQEADRFSIQSDPIRSHAMYMPEIQIVKRSASLHNQLGVCESSDHPSDLPNGMVCAGTNGYRFSQNYNKYLELLADHEDVDGYEVPLRAFIHDLSSDTNLASKQSHCSSFPAEGSQEGNRQDAEGAKVSLKPTLAPFYAQVFSGLSISSDTNKPLLPSCQLYNNVVSDELPKDFEPSSESALLSEQYPDGDISRRLVPSDEPVSIDNQSDSFDYRTSTENDQWSLSTASTVPCDLYFPPTSQRNSASSMLSLETELNLNHISTSSWC